MEVGHSGKPGAAALSRVAPEGKHACALAVILLHLRAAQTVEESALNLGHATLKIVPVSKQFQVENLALSISYDSISF